MKKLLIVSPYFPPDNTADMQRVRQSLSFYADYGWEVQVICVNSEYTEAYKDESLLQTFPKDIPIHRVKALSPKLTRKIGLGSIALRSLYSLYREGNRIIRFWKPDLIFISTTQFPSMILGSCWKSKFKIPYVLDFQDPWHHDHYLKLPPEQRPSKFWFSYRLNKYLEPIAVRSADGIIAVSKAYIDTLKSRYPSISSCPEAVVPFGASEEDLKAEYKKYLPKYFPAEEHSEFRIVYTGVINQEMLPVLRQFLVAFKQLISDKSFETLNLKLYFIGTSYGSGVHRKFKLVELSEELGLQDYIYEVPERVSFLAALQIQKYADLLLLPGTTDKNYIASKLAPYLISGRPIFAIFRKSSDAFEKLQEQKRVILVSFDSESELNQLGSSILYGLQHAILKLKEMTNTSIVHPSKYCSKALTGEQVQVFNKVYRLQQPINFVLCMLYFSTSSL
jgi:glycosyltransferase involved in cell wall biosynthesis